MSSYPYDGEDHLQDTLQRLRDTLQRLLAIQAPHRRPALDQACDLVAAAMRADKVEVFLYQAEAASLVAMGASGTPMGHKQREAGLNRQPIANHGPSVQTFLTGTPNLNGRIDQDPDQPRGMAQHLGIRSEIDVPLDVAGERPSIVQVDSLRADFFTVRDVHFVTAVSGWIGMVIHRAELFKLATVEAVR